ncbi:MAG TPA: helicase, partial [Clostridia bacterium]|nr:helicase [Clostridia bacterium]
MATKLHMVSELTTRTINKLTHSANEWMSFLHSAAWLYKYPWHEQVMIYAQRPDATACAPIALWNDTFHRWVNKGAKGIALIDDSGAKPALRYVFDASDTNSRSSVPFRLWGAKRQQYEQIVAELQNHFGDADIHMGTIQEYIMGVVANAVSDNYKDYANELINAHGGSGLGDKGASEIDVILFLHLIPSVTYATLVRMGIDPHPVINADSFPELALFDTPDTVAQLGAATADISEMVLWQIERTVRSIERQEHGRLANAAEVSQNEDRKDERSG